MTRNTIRLSWFALLALLLILGGCKGETPTAPPPGTTPPGNTPPPTGVTLTVTTSNNDPLVDSTVLITATVTDNGQPVPNGTAVEFSTTSGTFTDTNASTTVRTTTNGVATATLTAAVAGASRTTVTVNNVSRTVDVTFRARPITNPPPSTAPVITSIDPAIGRPAGGEVIRINGRNFTGPVRVLFDVGNGQLVEAFVSNRTDTFIDVTTPAVNLGAGQQLVSRIVVITAAGTTTEQRTEVAAGFTFRNQALTPVPRTLSPSSGPIEGGTRITIFGEAFQSPVQVLFGFGAVPSWQEARVIEVRYNEIIVEAPDARSTSPNGSGPITGPVDVRVVNINSGSEAVLGSAFRYISKMQITTIRPLNGSSLGNTELIIDGTGFDSPLDVQVAGVQAQVIEVTGSRLRVRTRGLPATCAGASGPIVITNTSNGDFDVYGDAVNEPAFVYNPVQAGIVGVSGNLIPGGTVSVTVRNPGVGPNGEGSPRFTIGGRTLIPSPSITTDPVGPTTFTFALPTTGFTFPTVACTTAGGEAGTQFGPTDATLTFTNVLAGCTDTITVAIQPPAINPCLTPPSPVVSDPAAPACATPPAVTVAGGATTDTITISNEPDSQALNITSVGITGPNAAEFSIVPSSATNIPANGFANFTLSFDPTSAGPKTATVTFNTNSPTRPQVTVCVQTTANP